ncbi:MAG: N-acetylmannosamine-6-phosphate 2-epimerase [bacterium]|nr:N-acetylmannosamine-6-phosphate 2-epimerase [bacterium]
MKEIIKRLKGGLIVSCQAYPGDAMYGSSVMSAFARASFEAGAVGIRANGVSDIKAIKGTVPLPVIGIYKENISGYGPYITPTLKHVEIVISAGADIVAVDATKRLHPEGLMGDEFIKEIKKRFNVILMADISNLEEGILAYKAGADLISTTLSGYTEYTKDFKRPNFELLKALVKEIPIPVIMEGNIWRPEEARYALDLGAYAVVVGSAITRPQLIAKKFVLGMKGLPFFE